MPLAVQLSSALVAQWLIGSRNDPLFGWAIPIMALVFGFILNARMSRQLLDHQDDSQSALAPGGTP